MDGLNEKLLKEITLEITTIFTLIFVNLLYYWEIISVVFLLPTILGGLLILLKTAIAKLIKKNYIGLEFFIAIAVTLCLLYKEYLTGSAILTIILIKTLKDNQLSRLINLLRENTEIVFLFEKKINIHFRWLTVLFLLIIGEFFIITGNIRITLILLIFFSVPDFDLIISAVKMLAKARLIKEKITYENVSLKKVRTLAIHKKTIKIIIQNIVGIILILYFITLPLVIYFELTPVKSTIVYLVPEIFVFFNSIKILNTRI
ncbi:hypothetical protein [Chryseobacterium indologenes]|uniref:hypothetical protein n=1 Tax=Chryseobacterium indologenes TaxID=253 RepID=UPI0009A1FCE3|nr:hypothetical protein [Chryseobacterium indologenes]